MEGKRTHSYKDLIVWQKSNELVKQVYSLTGRFPPAEKFGLANQLRRATVSVASNIAEGYGRTYFKERRQFLALARGSATEVETQLIISKELGFITEQELQIISSLTVEVLKMLSGLSRSLH